MKRRRKFAPPARVIAELGARRIAAEQRARIRTLRIEGGASDDEIKTAEQQADGFEQMAAAFKAGEPYLASLPDHQKSYVKGWRQ